MEGISTFNDFLSRLEDKYGNTEKIVCLLFAAPDNDEFGNRFYSMYKYYHARTGAAMDFFCPGYNRDLMSESYNNQSGHYFDYIGYARFINQFEKITTWEYKGGTNILIIPYQNGKLNFETVYDLNLTRMYIDGLVTDYRSFIEDLIRYIADIQFYLSNENDKLQGKCLWNNFSDYLPKFITRFIKQISDSHKINKHLSVHNISKTME